MIVYYQSITTELLIILTGHSDKTDEYTYSLNIADVCVLIILNYT